MIFAGIKRTVILLTLSALLTGCLGPAIQTDPSYNPPVYWGQHKVRAGETLYSIAWRYGRDFRELADANGIQPPYTIYPGQIIRLDRKGQVYQTDKKTSTLVKRSKKRPAKQLEKSVKPSVSNKKIQKPSVTVPSRSVSPVRSSGGAVAWQWPHVGKILDRYSVRGKINKGIDIAGRIGDPVRAAADGEVVYAGSGLLGYGNLVIINHNEHYLSAYAHNRRILVKEGERVKAGQVIAELGATGTRTPKLHFEIRRDGKPVDPLKYLPRNPGR